MTGLHTDLETALEETLASAAGQTDEFRRRLRRLVGNAAAGNTSDGDVREVIELAVVQDLPED